MPAQQGDERFKWQMINIAFVIDRVFSDRAGTEQQLLGLIRKLDRTRFRVFLCCLRETEFLKSVDFCEVHVLGVDSLLSLRAMKSAIAFVRFLRENRVDIVQTHFRDSNVFGVLCSRFAGVPAILSSRRGVPYWKNNMGRMITLFVNRFTDRFIVNSFSIERFLMEKECVNPQCIDVFPNSMDIDRLRRGAENSREQCREQLGVKSNEFVVGIVANLRPVKRHDVFIRAAAQLDKSRPGWRFVVVGTGAILAELQSMVHNLGLTKSFSFLGLRSDAPEITRAFDVGVLCSDYESTSNTLLEYVALGVPVVCTRVGDNSRYVEDGGNGFVVEPGDPQALAQAILRVREGLVVPSILEEKSAYVLDYFDADKVAARYVSKFTEIASDAI